MLTCVQGFLSMLIKLTNFAISWKITPLRNTRKAFEELVECYAESTFQVTYHANFAVLRCRDYKFVYVAFYGGHVNCTGISHHHQISTAVSVFNERFRTSPRNIKVQAIAATTNTHTAFTPDDILTIKSRVSSEDKLVIARDYFSGVLIRFKHGGMAQIFYSGKVNFLGVKTINQLIHMGTVIKSILTNVGQM